MFRFIIILMVTLVLSCKNQHVNKENPLYQDVMVIHDKVMPEMSNIHRLKKQLKSNNTPGAEDLILAKINQLNDADDAMMSWMASFSVPKDKSQEDAYLLAEKEKIQNVSDQMYEAIDNATHLLDSLNTVSVPK